MSTGVIPAPPPETTSPAPSSTTQSGISPPPPQSGNGNLPTGTLVGMVVGIGIGGIGMLVAVGVFFIFYRKWKRKKMREQGLENNYNSEGGPPLQDPKTKSEPLFFVNLNSNCSASHC